MIIAIDGPAGSGKSTTAREVARRLGFLHVDSGAFYRALTHALLAAGIRDAAWDTLRAEDLDRFGLRGERGTRGLRIAMDGRTLQDELRTADVTARVSHVARIPAVRAWLMGRLHQLADAEHAVIDGRDIGTVVFPQADLKIFLVADPEVRARRRLHERGVHDPTPAELMDEADRLKARDRLDSERAVAPLKPADDAIRVDTTALSFDEQVEAILELTRARAPGAPGARG